MDIPDFTGVLGNEQLSATSLASGEKLKSDNAPLGTARFALRVS
jgi:hypothetical protein